jgi:hypothetical protein
VRLADDDHVLVLTLHHLVCDLWSLGLILRELSAAYASAASGVEPALPELPARLRRLRGLEPCPGGRRRWARRSTRGRGAYSESRSWTCRRTDRSPPCRLRRIHRRAAAAALAASLESLAAAEAPPPSWCCWPRSRRCSIATRARTIGRGQPLAERDRPELEELVGLFVNTLVLPRTSVATPPSGS